MKVLVTGEAGFIESAVVCALIAGSAVVNLDKLIHAGNLASLVSMPVDPRYKSGLIAA